MTGSTISTHFKQTSAALFTTVTMALGAGATACGHHLDEVDVQDAHKTGEGVVRGYDATEDQMWKATLAVMHWVGADHVDERRAEHSMIGSTDDNLVTYGTYIGVWFQPLDGGHINVNVLSKRKVRTEAVTAVGEDAFHRDLAKALVYVKSNQPMPDKEP